MVWLFLACLAFAVISYWAGFKSRPHALQHLSQAGFFIFIALAVFSGYFAYKGHTAIDTLAQIIEPVPDIMDVSYIPTPEEAAVVSALPALITPPGKVPASRPLEDSIQAMKTRYWLVTSALTAGDVIRFYRNLTPDNGWSLNSVTPPWLRYSRGEETLSLYITENSHGGGSKILYGVRLSPR